MIRGMYEPPVGPFKVRPLRVHCTERVRITWTMPDGSTFTGEDITAPTPEVIAARSAQHEAEWICQQCHSRQGFSADMKCFACGGPLALSAESVSQEHLFIEVCLGCGKPTAERDCGCPAGTGLVKKTTQEHGAKE